MKVPVIGTLSSLNPVPWPAITGNCAAWIGYSYFKKDWFVFLANQPGFLMGLFYTFTAVGLSSSRTRDVMTAIILAAVVVWAAGNVDVLEGRVAADSTDWMAP